MKISLPHDRGRDLNCKSLTQKVKVVWCSISDVYFKTLKAVQLCVATFFFFFLAESVLHALYLLRELEIFGTACVVI